MSRSRASSSLLDHSGRLMILGAAGVSSVASNESKSKPTSPCSSARFCRTAWSTTDSCISASDRLVFPSWSKAPALISDSTVRRFKTAAGTLATKSWKSVKTPSVSLAVLMWSTTAWPTFRTAPSPKRIEPSIAAKFTSDSFTSGGRTEIFILRHSFK